MPQKQSTAESAKSMPITSVSSDCSLSFKSFNAAATDDLENDSTEQIESRATVKALIDKFGSLQGKLTENNGSNFNVKKKPFNAAVGEQLDTPGNEFNMYMKGDDAMRVDHHDVNDTVRCYSDLLKKF